MSLVVKSVEVRDFRSYECFLLELDPSLTVVVGPNAVGKTNLIEAIQLIASTESFRKPQWGDVVRRGSEKARVVLLAEGEGRELKMELTVSSAGRREYKVNGKLRRRLLDTAGILPCVVFTPDDLRLVKDSAEKRRAALDSLGIQLSPNYAQLKTDYEKVVRHRNTLLKEEAADGLIEPWTDQLIELGTRFLDARLRLFDRLSVATRAAHESVSEGSELLPVYQTSWERDGLWEAGVDQRLDAFREAVARKHREERARRVTLVGPHRDEIVFYLDGHDARAFSSQGQQRSIALAWKLGEVAVTRDVGGQPPILLLDDVMSELDEKRRHALTRLVGTVAQTVVTTTNIGYFEEGLLSRARVVSLA